VGLLFAGVLLGPHGLDIFGEKRPIADFLSDLGKLLLMFFAGLEIDIKLFLERHATDPWASDYSLARSPRCWARRLR
jgi:Kef-type K+ transport system membrane component KefB